MSICKLGGYDSGGDSAGRWRISRLLGLLPLRAGPHIGVWTSLHLLPHRPILLESRTGHHLGGLFLLCILGRKG
jgi:hypothetical protein